MNGCLEEGRRGNEGVGQKEELINGGKGGNSDGLHCRWLAVIQHVLLHVFRLVSQVKSWHSCPTRHHNQRFSAKLLLITFKAPIPCNSHKLGFQQFLAICEDFVFPHQRLNVLLLPGIIELFPLHLVSKSLLRAFRCITNPTPDLIYLKKKKKKEVYPK